MIIPNRPNTFCIKKKQQQQQLQSAEKGPLLKEPGPIASDFFQTFGDFGTVSEESLYFSHYPW